MTLALPLEPMSGYALLPRIRRRLRQALSCRLAQRLLRALAAGSLARCLLLLLTLRL